MNTSELKLKLFRQIDTLEKSKLEKVYGLFLNLLNSDDDSEQWNTLSESRKQGLLNALEEMNHSEGAEHQSVMEKYKTKYA